MGMVTPRFSEHRIQLMVMAGFPSFFKDPTILKRLLGKQCHSDPPPLRTNPYLNPLQKCASAAGSGDFITMDSGV